MDLQQLGKLALLAAVVLGLLGGLLLLAGRLGIDARLGSLPGDIRIKGESWSCFVPITTSILLSVLLTIVLWVVRQLFR